MKKSFFMLLTLLAVSDVSFAYCHSEYVGGLDPYGDNFLSVRSGPSSRYRRIDTLHTGDKVGVCEYRGSWKRIYYGTNGSCSIRNGEIIGRCYSGWAYGKYLR